MDAYKSGLYTGPFQGPEFFLASGAGFHSLGDGDSKAILTALKSTDPMLHQGFRQ
jgi:hypothetical protein